MYYDFIVINVINGPWEIPTITRCHNHNKSFSSNQDSRQQLDHLSPDNGGHFLALSAREGDLQRPQLLGDTAVLYQSAEDTDGKVCTVTMWRDVHFIFLRIFFVSPNKRFVTTHLLKHNLFSCFNGRMNCVTSHGKKFKTAWFTCSVSIPCASRSESSPSWTSTIASSALKTTPWPWSTSPCCPSNSTCPSWARWFSSRRAWNTTLSSYYSGDPCRSSRTNGVYILSTNGRLTVRTWPDSSVVSYC